MSIDEKRLQEIENSISSAVSSFGPAIMTLNFDSRDFLVMTTEIRTLRAENERLKADVSSWEEDGAVLPEDMSITETVNALRAEKESLREACKVAEQTLRNFANGDLKGDAQVIAHNAAYRLFNLLQD